MPSLRLLPASLRRAGRREPPPPPRAQPERPVGQAIVDCGVYLDGVRQPGHYSPTAAVAAVRDARRAGRQGFVWIGLHEPDAAQMHDVATIFRLHPLAAEDAVQAHQRPKLERYDDSLFLVLKTINYVPHDSVSLAREIVETGEIMIFVGVDFVVTVRHGDHSGLWQVRTAMDEDPAHLRHGPYAVLHAIADHVVDHYLEVTGLMETDIDNVEEMAFTPGRRTDVEPIYLLKRSVVELRRSIAPLSLAFQRLQVDNRDLISEELRRYLRDVADHQVHAADQVTSYDDMLSSLVDAALARVGMQQNADMRKISAWAAMLAVPTLIAGIYGMNFTNMPTLTWTWGYPVTLLVMVTVCVFLYRTFRRNDWL